MLSRYVRPLAILAMLHAGSPSQLVYAQGQALREMGHATWTAGDGAPQAITHLAQDPDGSLWIGSESGLFNFDGQTFRPFESPPGEPRLPVGEVYSLLVTKAGTLWVGFNKVGLARVAAGRVTLYDAADAKPIGSVEQLREAPMGAFGPWTVGKAHWFGTDGGWLTEPAPTSGLIAGILSTHRTPCGLLRAGFFTGVRSPSPYVRTEVPCGCSRRLRGNPEWQIWINDEDPTILLAACGSSV
jgi:hypothetical protein